jgi:Ca2+-binding RTX toxin-like protein
MKSQFAHVRPRFGLGRALRRGIALAAAVGLVAVPSAGAVTYPQSGGNGFDTNAEGWTGTTATCNPTVGSLCTESNFYSAAQGNPPGSIASQIEVVANAGDVFTGHATWRSPSFTAATVGGGTLSYDRSFTVSGIATLQPTATVETVLVDETKHRDKSLGSETISGGSQTVNDTSVPFATHSEVVPADTLVVGHDYHLELRSTTTTDTARVGITGTSTVGYDNVGVELRNEGPDGSSGSSGVTFTGSPLSQKEIKKLIRKVNWAANAGHLPGGSVVSRNQCTIVGTPHADRIKGSRGNDVICGLGGNDTINGRGGKDVIDTGKGNDHILASKGADVVAGLAGRDRLYGNAGADRIGGGAANDKLSGGANRDRLNGGSGKDRLLGSARHDRVTRVERRG